MTPRRLFFTVWLCLVLFFGTGSLSNLERTAVAQAPAASSGVKSQTTNNYYVDGAIVVVLFGGALFAVCRSSRRN